MTDPRPVPRYGEYAEVPAGPPPEAPAPAPARPRRTWDLVLATGLLVWGTFDVVTGFGQFANLGAALRAAYELQGMPPFASAETADRVGGWLNLARVVILTVAIAGTLLLVARRRLAFWVPLAAGVLAAVVVTVVVLAIVLNDPAFAAHLAEMTGR